MDDIGKEEKGLEAQLTELRGKIAGADSIGATINSAQALLEKLRKRLDEPICWDLKRRVIEVLVAGGEWRRSNAGVLSNATSPLLTASARTTNRYLWICRHLITPAPR